jgi:hypothetical protein
MLSSCGAMIRIASVRCKVFVVFLKAAWSTFETLVGLWLTMNVQLPEKGSDEM